MACDEQFVNRVRARFADEPDLVEKKMFGGIAFLVGGHMAIAASGRGDLMVRVEPEETAELVARPGVSRMVMQARELDGWLRVTEEACAQDDDLDEWVTRGLEYVHDLPPKPPKPPRSERRTAAGSDTPKRRSVPTRRIDR